MTTVVPLELLLGNGLEMSEVVEWVVSSVLPLGIAKVAG